MEIEVFAPGVLGGGLGWDLEGGGRGKRDGIESEWREGGVWEMWGSHGQRKELGS